MEEVSIEIDIHADLLGLDIHRDVKVLTFFGEVGEQEFGLLTFIVENLCLGCSCHVRVLTSRFCFPPLSIPIATFLFYSYILLFLEC